MYIHIQPTLTCSKVKYVRTGFETCSKLTIKKPKRLQDVILVSLLKPNSSVFIFILEHVIHGYVTSTLNSTNQCGKKSKNVIYLNFLLIL